MSIRYFLSTLMITLALVAAPVLAAVSDTKAAATSTGQEKPSDVKKQSPRRAKFVKGPSEESRAERDRRLKRECKGRPNAGACLGYTR
jgi:hypothetical protein